MESTEGSSHKPSIEPLTISQAPSSNPLTSEDAEVTFSEDYNDSPRSTEMKSPLDGASSDSCGDSQSDDWSSLGTTEADDDAKDIADGQNRQPDLNLSLVRASSAQSSNTAASQHANNEDEEDEFDSHVAPRRSTSLKTGKSPSPGSARKKKEVRFADALGLDLESVKHIMNASEPPIVPASAKSHLMLRSESADFTPYRRRLLHTCFSQPGMSQNFAARVLERRVSLETCLVTNSSIDGVVRVANIAYEKHVCVRYTLNGWLAFTDVNASYVHGSSNGSTDQFRFSIALPNTFGVLSNAVEFSVRFEAGSGGSNIFWDSNFGANYRVECYVS